MEKITVFVEGKQPVEIAAYRSMKVADVVRQLEIDEDKISEIFSSPDKIGPVSSRYIRDSIFKIKCRNYIDYETDELGDPVLWIGFYPKYESMLSYNWVGNNRKKMSYDAFLASFVKRAKFVPGTEQYEIQGIKAKSPEKLFKKYVKSQNVELI